MDFEKIAKIEYKEIALDSILYYPQVRDLCHYPYPGYPKGCINIEKCRKSKVPYFKKLVKEGSYIYFYLVYIIIDFKKYKETRKIENPDFYNSERRLKCLLYWQKSIKAILKEYFQKLHEVGNRFYVLGCGSGFSLSFQEEITSMENVCINVFSTLKLNKISFEIKPVEKIVLISIEIIELHPLVDSQQLGAVKKLL